MRLPITRAVTIASVLLIAGCATPPPPPPPAPQPKVVYTNDYRAAEATDALWRQQGIASTFVGTERTEADGSRTLLLRSLTLPLSEPLAQQQVPIMALATLAAKGEQAMSLIVSVKTPAQQQQVGAWIKQAAIGSGGKNGVILDNRRGPNNPLQLTLQYQ